MKRHIPLCAAALVLLSTLVALPDSAEACGGLFCSQPPPIPAPPEPVDQNAERIIFEVTPGEVTAHVQIQYFGDADAFAWIIPVPAVPEVEEGDVAFFDQVEAASSLGVTLPQQEPCPSFSGGGGRDDSGGCGLFGASDTASGSASDDGGGGGFANNAMAPPVTVFDHDFTENFEYVVVGAESTMVLVDWLMENGYNVSANMTPVMEPYNGEHGKFLAVKLRDGKKASDIAPLKFKFEADAPMVPIQMTAVAAQPMMGILIYILAPEPYVPGNYDSARPDAREILHDADGTTSYFEWVARRADEADGKFWVEEYIGPYGDQTLSRYYTRMSPQHMTVDPFFIPDTGAVPNTSRTIDLSESPTLYRCGALIEERVPSACGFNYCGKGSTCSVVNGLPACTCPDDQVVQTVQGPDGLNRPTCVPSINPFGVTNEAVGEGTEFDPCANRNCGEGQCVLKGGFATCACDEGAAGLLVSGSNVSCNLNPSTNPSFGPGAGVESMPKIAAAPLRTPNDRPSERNFVIGLLLPMLGIGVWMWRRR